MEKKPKTCDCTIYPFTQECVDACSGKILRYAKALELREHFNFPEELSEKVYEIASNPDLTNLSDFSPYLEPSEMEQVISLFALVGERGRAWLRTEFKKRLEAFEELREPAFA